MKVKYWEMTKEDLERFASCVMDQTLKTLAHENYANIDDCKDFAKLFIPIAITPDSVSEDVRDQIFPKENLNQNCIIRIVKIK